MNKIRHCCYMVGEDLGITGLKAIEDFPETNSIEQLVFLSVLKAIEESKKGKLCVMLLPVSTSTKLFHDHIKSNAKEIRFVKGRIKFLGTNTKGEYVTNKAPMHDSMIVIF